MLPRFSPHRLAALAAGSLLASGIALCALPIEGWAVRAGFAFQSLVSGVFLVRWAVGNRRLAD